MAIKYLLNTATGAADGTSWTDAYTTFAAASQTLYVCPRSEVTQWLFGI